METAQDSGWTVIDAFDVMIHLFLSDARERYGSHPGVTIVPKALAGEEGTARMHITPAHTGSSLLAPRPEPVLTDRLQ